VKWTSEALPEISQPVIADLDGDGKAEILCGPAVVNFDGSTRWVNSTPPTYSGGGQQVGGSVQAVDLNLDGTLDVVNGPSAFDKDGHLLWSWSTAGSTPPFTVTGKLNGGATTVTLQSNYFLGDAFTAVANLDDDPFPEIIAVNRAVGSGSVSSLWIFQHDGRLKNSFPLFQDTSSVAYDVGAPTVADLDGDRQPEVVVPVKRSPQAQTADDPRRVTIFAYNYTRDGRLQVKWQRDGAQSSFGFAASWPLAGL